MNQNQLNTKQKQLEPELEQLPGMQQLRQEYTLRKEQMKEALAAGDPALEGFTEADIDALLAALAEGLGSLIRIR